MPLSTLTNARPVNSMWIEPEGVTTGEASGTSRVREKMDQNGERLMCGRYGRRAGKQRIAEWFHAHDTNVFDEST